MASKAIQANSKQNVAHAETNAGRPKRVCSRKSYCEVETDDELAAEDVKQYKPKGKMHGTDLKSLRLHRPFVIWRLAGKTILSESYKYCAMLTHLQH